MNVRDAARRYEELSIRLNEATAAACDMMSLIRAKGDLILCSELKDETLAWMKRHIAEDNRRIWKEKFEAGMREKHGG